MIGDGHRTRVMFWWGRKRTSGQKQGQYRARCACGWQGPVRDNRVAAEDDEFAHNVTEREYR